MRKYEQYSKLKAAEKRINEFQKKKLCLKKKKNLNFWCSYQSIGLSMDHMAKLLSRRIWSYKCFIIYNFGFFKNYSLSRLEKQMYKNLYAENSFYSSHKISFISASKIYTLVLEKLLSSTLRLLIAI